MGCGNYLKITFNLQVDSARYPVKSSSDLEGAGRIKKSSNSSASPLVYVTDVNAPESTHLLGRLSASVLHIPRSYSVFILGKLEPNRRSILLFRYVVDDRIRRFDAGKVSAKNRLTNKSHTDCRLLCLSHSRTSYYSYVVFIGSRRSYQ